MTKAGTDGNADFWLNDIFVRSNCRGKENILIAVTTFPYLEEIRENVKTNNTNADVEFVADVFPNKAVCFGQYREDAIVEIVLKKHTHDEIKYLEVGIPDPINGSNTYHFYLNGHTGVCGGKSRCNKRCPEKKT